MAFVDCLGRVPFASIIATLVCVVGVGVFCGTLWKATDLVQRDVVASIFHLDEWTNWITVVTVAFIIAGCIIGVFAICLLVFGFLATGATRKNIYTGTRCIMGGRITAIFLMFLAYLFNVVWLCVMIALSAGCFFVLMIWAWCQPYGEEAIDDQSNLSKHECFRLHSYGINFNVTALQVRYPDRNIKAILCQKTEVNKFCQKISEIQLYYYIALGGSIMVIIGLITFLMVLTSNYRHISTTKELTYYREAIDLQSVDMELTSANAPSDHRLINSSLRPL